MIRTAVLCAALALLPCAGRAEVDSGSAGWMMPGCRGYLARSGTDRIKRGLCEGEVGGVAYAARFCAPPTVTREEEVRAVVGYIEDRPARHQEPFRRLAEEALAATWPCRR